ncbi:hypothetical protein FRC03_002071 [Tulasnella sp. 419]|nr:hypothetical protein FRC03_002071 [Tulasnella sp. 419]
MKFFSAISLLALYILSVTAGGIYQYQKMDEKFLKENPGFNMANPLELPPSVNAIRSNLEALKEKIERYEDCGCNWESLQGNIIDFYIHVNGVVWSKNMGMSQMNTVALRALYNKLEEERLVKLLDMTLEKVKMLGWDTWGPGGDQEILLGDGVIELVFKQELVNCEKRFRNDPTQNRCPWYKA